MSSRPQNPKEVLETLKKGILLSHLDPKNEGFEEQYKKTPYAARTPELEERWERYNSDLEEYATMLKNQGINMHREVDYGNVVSYCFFLIDFNPVYFLRNNGFPDAQKSWLAWFGKEKREETEYITEKAPGLKGLFGGKVTKAVTKEVEFSGMFLTLLGKDLVDGINELANQEGLTFTKDQSGFSSEVGIRSGFGGRPGLLLAGFKDNFEDETDMGTDMTFNFRYDSGRSMADFSYSAKFPVTELKKRIIEYYNL